MSLCRLLASITSETVISTSFWCRRLFVQFRNLQTNQNT